MGPAWEIDYEGGDQAAAKNQLSWGMGGYAAMAGYPHITIPLGLCTGLARRAVVYLDRLARQKYNRNGPMLLSRQTTYSTNIKKEQL